MIYKDDFFSIWKDWLKEVVASKILTLFEPETKSIPNVRIGQARFVSGQLAKSPGDSFIRFPQCYGRNTTLAGIWMFLGEDHKREYLVTAFGKRKGSGVNRPAQFYGLHISHGTEHEAKFSPTGFDYFQKHVLKIDNAEVLICHNHPRNFASDLLSQLVDWSPLPSNRDRETTFQLKYPAIVDWLVSGSFRNIRFFLVEKGRFREIQLPPADIILKMLRELTIHSGA